MSISVSVSGIEGLSRYERMLQNLSNPQHKSRLLNALGGLVESQTQRRIANEKRAPDGTPWKPWSSRYAQSRHGNQGLLMGSGALLNSIEFQVESNQVRIGSPLAYAGVHQNGFSGGVTVKPHTRRLTQVFGKALSSPMTVQVNSFTRQMNVVKRPYLGLSRRNQREVVSVIGRYFEELTNGTS